MQKIINAMFDKNEIKLRKIIDKIDFFAISTQLRLN